MKKPPKTMKIDPNRLKTRDHLLLKVIGGATKAGIAVDRKKEANKRTSRKPIRKEEHE
jgi:hypothetical protein